MDKIKKFFIIVIVGLWITGFTLSIFRPELLGGISDYVIGITYSAIVLLVIIGYFYILVNSKKKWVKALLLILGVILLLMNSSLFNKLFNKVMIKLDIRTPRPIVQETPNENEETKIKSLFKNTQSRWSRRKQ